MACPLGQGQSRRSPCLQDLVGQGEVRPLQTGKAQRDRGCDRGWGESAVQEPGRWEQAAAAACVTAPGGGAGHPPKPPVCRGHCSALCVAQTFLPPEPRESR